MKKLLAAIALAFFASTAHAASPVADLQVSAADAAGSTASGVAPLWVHFNATASTDADETNPFRDLQYKFDFDDAGSGNWPQWTGTALPVRSKNSEDGGPLAGHLYENAGTYNVSVQVRDAQGNATTDTATITVTDPDTVFSGTNTVCISTTTDMTGCPAGATELTNQSSWPSWSSDTRYLLTGGENFGSFGSVYPGIGVDTMQLGSYGTGKARIGSLQIPRSVGSHSISSIADWPSNIVAYNLQVDGNTLGTGISSRGITFWNINTTDTETTGCNDNSAGDAGIEIEVGASIDWMVKNDKYPASLIYNPHNIAFIGLDTTTGSCSKIFSRGQAAWMENELSDAWEHSIRAFHAYNAIFMHNRLLGGAGKTGKSNIKLHSNGLYPTPLYPNVWSDLPAGANGYPAVGNVDSGRDGKDSRYIVMAHNDLGEASDTRIWNGLGGQPQNSNGNEGVQDLIREYNYYRDTARTSTHITTNSGGRNLIHRAAIVEAGRSLQDNAPDNTPDSGTASGMTTDAAGYSAGATSITLASAGTGSILISDSIFFDNHDTEYHVQSGSQGGVEGITAETTVSDGGTITIWPALTDAIPSSATGITLLDWDGPYSVENAQSWPLSSVGETDDTPSVEAGTSDTITEPATTHAIAGAACTDDNLATPTWSVQSQPGGSGTVGYTDDANDITPLLDTLDTNGDYVFLLSCKEDAGQGDGLERTVTDTVTITREAAAPSPGCLATEWIFLNIAGLGYQPTCANQ